MSIHKTLAASAAIAVSMAAGAASAATYDLSRQNTDTLFSFTNPVMTSMSLTRNGSTATSTAQIGGYAITGDNVASDETWNFVGWCVDLFTAFNHGGTASMEIDRYETSSTEPSGIAWSGRFDNVESFFERVYDPAILSDPILAGGWQLAIWELLYENNFATDGASLQSGTFQAFEHTSTVKNAAGVVRSSSLATEQAAWDAADNFLADWLSWSNGDPMTDWDFTYFTAVDGRTTNQTLITVTPPPATVPLPVPALLLIGGLAALGAMKRRKA